MGSIEHFGFYDDMISYGMHRHTSCEILYLHAGETLLCSGGRQVPMKAGMLYIVPSCVIHDNRLTDKSVYKRTLLFFDPRSFCSSIRCDVIMKLLMGFTVQFPVAVRDDFGARELIAKIGGELERKDALSEYIAEGLLAQLIAGIMRASDCVDLSPEEPEGIVTAVKEHIRLHSAEPLKISDVAESFYISKYYLTHIFKEQTGMSPKQFLTYTRLSNAYSMLYDGSVKLSEVAARCGFVSPSDMTKKFREHYGLSPSQFRKELKTSPRG